MKYLRHIIICIVLLNTFSTAIAQKDFVSESIDEINFLMENSRDYFDDEDIIESNNEVLDIFLELMEEDDAFGFNYDSLKYISKLESEDGKLRIFTWNILFSDMTNKFFGYIQYQPEEDYYLGYELIDKTDNKDDSFSGYRNHKKWFGAIYYDIIEKKHKDKTIYTLLGWKGKTAEIQQKVIETLEFSRGESPVFGNKNILLNNKKQERIVFSLSSKAQMLLRYNNLQDIIVCDHLSPGDPNMEGHFEYYGPDYSFDAFNFSSGKWHFESDIDPDIAINYKMNKKLEMIKKREPEKEF